MTSTGPWLMNLRRASKTYRKLSVAMALGGAQAALWLVSLTAGAVLATPAQAQTFGCTPAMANDIVCENSKAGTPSSTWDMVGAGDASIQGFATDISYNRGQTAFFKVKSDASAYRLDIYRLGYYGGAGARQVASVNPSAALPQTQPTCLTDAAEGLHDCGNWAVSASWNIPSNATSGIYFANVVRTDTGGHSHIYFIVRNDASHSAVLLQTSDSTWQAYNNYGGHSLYGGTAMDLTNRAHKVSYNRPFGMRDRDTVLAAEYPMVRWLEANGYDVSYFTSVDSDRNGFLIGNHKVFVSSGHDEYWSGGQRTNVEAARDSGVNLAFFSGNEVFWKTRWETSIDGSGTAYRTLVCYKETLAGAQIDPMAPEMWTGTWRDPRFSPPADGGKPENSLTGTLFMVNGPGGDNSGLPIKVTAEDGKMRFWRNTSIANLTSGNIATLPGGTLGYEWDITEDNGFQPAGLFHLSTTAQNLTVSYLLDYGGIYGSGTATHHMTQYRASSGALVFGAGTVQWSWGLDSTHDNPLGYATPAANVDMQQATVNLLADMSAQPATLQSGLLLATKSTDTIAPASGITSPTSGAAVTTGVPLTVTGTASDSGSGVVGGVEVSTDNGQTWHPATGRGIWTYTFTPSQMGPMTLRSRAVDDSGNLETPGSGVSVTTQGAYSISGTISPAAAGSGATITVSGAWSATATVDGSGNYTVSNLPNGEFTVSPSKPGYMFTWASQAVLINGANVTGVNFTAAPSGGATYSISGSVSPTAYRADVTITVTGAGSASTVTGAPGTFSISGLANGTYTLTPSKPGFIFSPVRRTVTVTGANVSGVTFSAQPFEQTLLTTQTPADLSESDGQDVNYELGARIRSTVAGQIRAIRFWKAAAETGIHVGHIWASDGQMLAEVTFSNETASGWQRQDLATPVTITANTTYVVSVNTGNTFYVATNNGLATTIVNGDLRSATGSNGVFGSPAQFPTDSFAQTNYFRDIVFVASTASTLSSLSLSQGNMMGGSSQTATVTLSSPAPAGGAVVTLVSDNPAATVPGSVTVSAGATSATFAVGSVPVGTSAAVLISGIYNAMRMSILVIDAPAVATLSVNPTSVPGGNPSTGTVVLNGPAAAGGAVVTLSDNSAAASVPASVTVPAGATSASFSVSTSAVASTVSATISGVYHGTQTTTLTILAPQLSSILLNPNPVVGGVPSTGTVVLSSTAPAGGAFVTLWSDNTVTPGISAVTDPGELPHDGSTNWMNLGPSLTEVPSGTVVPVTGVPGLTVSVSTPLDLPLMAVTQCPATDCWGGNFAPGAPLLYTGGSLLDDESWQGNAPLSLTFSNPQRGVAFQIQPDYAAISFSATVCAYNSADALLGCIPFAGQSTEGGDNSAIFVGLYDEVREITKITVDAGGNPYGLAVGNIIVANSTSHPMVPIGITVPAGATGAVFAVNTNAVSDTTTVNISGSYNGSTRTTPLTINPPAISGISLSPTSVTGGSVSTATVTLNGPSPAGGAVVMLSADGPEVAGIYGVTSPNGLPHDGSITWTNLGAQFAEVPSGSAVPVTSVPGLNVTVSTATNQPFMVLKQCPGDDCGWGGNFAPGATVLYSQGSAAQDVSWTGNVPVTLAFSFPQRGVGFQIQPDFTDITFTATLCAYSTSNTLLGCIPLTGQSTENADGSAIFIGVYDDMPEISKVTVTTGNSHGLSIGQVFTTDTTLREIVPSSVMIMGGASSVNFQVRTYGVGSVTPVSITGNYNGTRSAVLTINPPALASVALNPTSVMGASASAGTVTLSGPAPVGGAIVTLSSGHAAASVPASVTVAAGTTSAGFSVGTSSVGSATSAVITGNYQGGTKSATLTINPGVPTTLLLSPATVVGGSSSVGTLTLNGPAPTGGAVVTLSSDNLAAAVPANVTVVQGQTTATFSVLTSPVITATSVNVSANYNGALISTLTINPPALSSLSLHPSSIAGGNSTTGTVTLNGPAPAGGSLVTLSDDYPVTVGIAGVGSPSALPQSSATDWAAFGPDYSSVASGVVVPVTGQPGVNMTLTTSTGLPMMYVTNCAMGGDCGWYGNFASGASMLWMSGTWDGATSTWTPNGPLTITFSSPQRGVGMQIMPDEAGTFTATLCAYNSSNTLIGCAPFTGNATFAADNSAVFAGLYDDVQEIAKVTVDVASPLYPHDFVIGAMSATAARRQMTPPSVTVPAGATSANFPVSTSAVSAATAVNITGNYNGSRIGTLTLNPPGLSDLSLNPATVVAGSSSTGTVSLNGPAPAGGIVVTLSSDAPSILGIEAVHSAANLPQSSATDWAALGPDYSSVTSGVVVPVTGQPGVNVTLSTSTGLPMMYVTNCAMGGDCGWYGNFASGASMLWMSGTWDGATSTWTPNGPLTITFSSPQRGVGMQIMPDEAGTFTATLCAYNSSNTLIGCAPFTGNGTGNADNSAIFAGLYDDVQEIAKVTVDVASPLYPHDFVIGAMSATAARRQMTPPSVTVPAGATSANFPVSTKAVAETTSITITANYTGTRTAMLTLNPLVLSGLSLNPATVVAGTSSTGTVSLNGPAPAGGIVVTLSSDAPSILGIEAVHSAANLPQSSATDWAALGPDYSSVTSGVVVPVTGQPGVNVTLSTSTGLPMMYVTNCAMGGDCGWYGNFASGASMLWMSGTWDGATSTWTPNGPLTITFSSPQRGVGMQIMPDEAGTFTATLCAYNSSNTLIGCAPFTGNGTGNADNSAIFAGLYDDVQEIAKITVDVASPLYPHDFVIGAMSATAARRQMTPPSVTVPAGATSADFPVSTSATITETTSVTITGEYATTHTGTLTINP